jgi:hypothetical protein
LDGIVLVLWVDVNRLADDCDGDDFAERPPVSLEVRNLIKEFALDN